LSQREELKRTHQLALSPWLNRKPVDM